MLARCCNVLLSHYSRFLYKYPIVFLIATPLVLIFCAVFSFVPAVGPDFPDFSEPTKGFEPRGTAIMKRVVTRENTLEHAINSGELTCEVKQKKGKRSAPVQRLHFCPADTYRYYSVVTVYESGGDLFNVKDLKTVCSMEEKIIRSTPGFSTHCSCYTVYPSCGPSLSLGTNIASLRNRSSCHEITAEDVAYAKSILQNCSIAFFAGKIKEKIAIGKDVPTECGGDNRGFVYNAFTLLVDVDFPRSSEILRNTMALSPSRYDLDFARDVYENHLTGGRPEENGVKLVAFKYGDFKFDQFNIQLLLDAVFPAVGLIAVALILLLYTHSFLVMGLTVFSVITSVIIAYFIYHQIFRLTFFPFLNILAFIFLVGIGADDAFVFNDVWAQAKLANPSGSIEDWIQYTLSHAALSMFVTSFTTAAAFYANVVSDITAIRLFGIYAGTSVLILYSLMVTWFPAGVVAVEKIRQSRSMRIQAVEMQQNPSLSPSAEGKESVDVSPPLYMVDDPATVSGHNGENLVVTTTDGPSVQMSPNHPGECPCWFYNTLRTKCATFMRKLFEKWIPSSLRGYPIWLLAFLALGIGMICAVAVKPGLQRPRTSEFQVFAGSHILEQYDFKYKDKFRLELSDKQNIFWIFVFFGFKAEDNGNYLEPDNFGTIEYDDSLDVTQPEAQKWFMEDLCSAIRNQSFFGKNVPWFCFPETFKNDCSIGGHSFPFSTARLQECISQYPLRTQCKRYNPGIFFHGDKVKGIGLPFPTNIPYTTEYSKVDSLWGKIEDFASSVLDKSPKGIQNGWAVSWLRFYALQRNLGTSTITSLAVSLAIAFGVMLLTSRNWVISLYAIVTIICTLATTIGSLVLDGWELNILESIVISVAVGLSVDFTLHYSVAYTVSPGNGRVNQVKYALGHIGPAVTLAAITTFIAGAFMMFSTVLAYFQLGQFLTLVMAISWLYATFFFMSLCYFAGPVGHFGQITSTKCTSCKVNAE